jgi:hypothetical protein
VHAGPLSQFANGKSPWRAGRVATCLKSPLRALKLDERAFRLRKRLGRPEDHEWEALTEPQRDFYRECVREVFWEISRAPKLLRVLGRDSDDGRVDRHSEIGKQSDLRRQQPRAVALGIGQAKFMQSGAGCMPIWVTANQMIALRVFFRSAEFASNEIGKHWLRHSPRGSGREGMADLRDAAQA